MMGKYVILLIENALKQFPLKIEWKKFFFSILQSHLRSHAKDKKCPQCPLVVNAFF